MRKGAWKVSGMHVPPKLLVLGCGHLGVPGDGPAGGRCWASGQIARTSQRL